jgi:hypothetical protein
MKYLVSLGLLIVMMAGFGCSGIKIDVEFDPEIDFAQYKTYRWARQKQQVMPRRPTDIAFMDKRIKYEADSILAMKGYVKAKHDDEAEFLVAYFLTAEDRVNVTYYGYGYGGYGWGPHGGYASTYRYKEGTLVMDIVDAAEMELVWRGWASTDIHSREEAHYMIPRAVRETLKRFPPEKK